jgi:hypothetical protein
MPDGRAAQSRVIGCRITGFRSRARARLEGLIQQVDKHTIDGEIPEKRHPQLARECPDAQARYVFFGSPGFRHGPEERSGMEGAFQSHGCSGAVMGVQEIRQTFLGIDFSGNHLKWRTDRTSNVYIAKVHLREGRPALSTLQTVQELPGQGEPFQRLVKLLKAAAIDAPFSVPHEYLPPGGHKALLEQVASIGRPQHRPFPEAQDFVCCILAGRYLLSKKPLRESERAWSKNINVRSALWAGPRGGAAMTAACLMLLHETQNPLWP